MPVVGEMSRGGALKFPNFSNDVNMDCDTVASSVQGCESSQGKGLALTHLNSVSLCVRSAFDIGKASQGARTKSRARSGHAQLAFHLGVAGVIGKIKSVSEHTCIFFVG